MSSQLAEGGYAPDTIKYLVLSHMHFDHVGNANDFAGSGTTWLVQKVERDAIFGDNVPPQAINPDYAALKNAKTQLLNGDHDVFGDGTVVIKVTPGHTVGHQVLFLKLPKTGPVVLSGDLYHYPAERTLGRMPDRERTAGTPESRAKVEALPHSSTLDYTRTGVLVNRIAERDRRDDRGTNQAARGLTARGESLASHRDGRGAPPARRDDREYREYLSEEQRSRRGCIASRMQPDFHHGLLSPAPDQRSQGPKESTECLNCATSPNASSVRLPSTA